MQSVVSERGAEFLERDYPEIAADSVTQQAVNLVFHDDKGFPLTFAACCDPNTKHCKSVCPPASMILRNSADPGAAKLAAQCRSAVHKLIEASLLEVTKYNLIFVVKE